jgi:hypothetical protein
MDPFLSSGGTVGKEEVSRFLPVSFAIRQELKIWDFSECTPRRVNSR